MLNQGVFSKKSAFMVVVLVAIAGGFTGGFYYNDIKFPEPVNQILVNQDLKKPDGVDFSMFWDVWNLVKDRYVDNESLNTENMVYGAIRGMVDSIKDPYTIFLEPSETKAFNDDISGIFSGIGIEIGIRNEVLTVVAPLKNTPAEKAGILAGDVITMIGDKSTDGMTSNEAVSLIRGPRGTSVKLTISRSGLKEQKEFTIVRDTIKTPTVSWSIINGNIAYIQLFVFNKNIDSDFKRAVKEIEKSNADRIILDLRNNPGGLLESSIGIANYFLDPNLIVTKEVFGGGREEAFYSSANGQLKNYPLIIIVNQGSASASEILAGAIKDNRHITIVGEKSFGKGLVQEVNSLEDGASVKITIAKWFTPNGTSINDNGIMPDIEIKMTEDDINSKKDPQLDKAVELIKNLK